MDSMVVVSRAFRVAGKNSVTPLSYFDSCLANVQGCASLMALVGSALVLMWKAAFSLAVSAASTLGIDPLLVFLFLPVKLNIEVLRFLAMVRKAAGANYERLGVAKVTKESRIFGSLSIELCSWPALL